MKFEKYRLANGLDVILLEDHRLPLAAVNIWYHVGPANERPGLTGFAHLFEHMMFEGSKHVGEKAHFQYLEAAGASEINGTTDFDRTNYFETVPSDQLELALWLESDRMGYLLEKVDARNLENQRDVVRNERRQSVENTPYGIVAEEFFHLLFPSDHPYYASVIGSHADIEAARLADVREFFRLFYAPNNASLAVVGDIDPAKTRDLIERYFGPIPAGPPVPPVQVKTPPITSERRAVVGDDVELPRVYMGWLTSPVFAPGDAEADILARILGGGKSSRLYRRLVYELRIAQDVAAHQYSLALGSIFTIEATAKPGVTPEQLEIAIDRELEALRTEGPSAEEVDGARNTIQTALIRGLETLGGFGGVADRLNLYNHFLGDPGYLSRDLARYDAVTPAALLDLARTSLTSASRVVLYGVPGEKALSDVPRTDHAEETVPVEEVVLPGQEWRAEPPKPGKQSHLQLPVPTRFRLDNGLVVYLVSQRNLPIVSANLLIVSGSDRNPVDRPGLASFTASMLDEGTERRPALELARIAEQLGASLSTGSTTDVSYVSTRVLTWNADAAFDLLADVVLHPVFPEHEIERIRNDRLTHLRQQKDDPNAMASKVFMNAVFGPGHPYGFTEIGTEDSNKAITREELVSFWRAGYGPANAALVVAGDLSEAELRTLAERHFGGWSGPTSVAAPPDGCTTSRRRVLIVDKPGAPQVALRIGHTGIARSSPDYAAADVMNTALGGLFSSRINLNLREKNGFTYGASSAFVFRRGAGPFLVATSVRTDVAGAAVREIFNELELMKSTDTTPAELDRAKDSISRSLPGAFETSSQSASSIGQLFVHGLPDDYYRGLPAQIDGVTQQDVRRVASALLRPGDAVVVAVGDRASIEPQLGELGLGTIECRDLEGRPIE